MTEKLTTYDPGAALIDDEEIAAFMADAFETGDAAYVAKALGVVARAKEMIEISRKTGLSRKQLSREDNVACQLLRSSPRRYPSRRHAQATGKTLRSPRSPQAVSYPA
ncbi:addiction module antidote protein [Agrobacterium tumefaciens]|uniref:addiction module antidote protein n=1 Tax=Agrobacterium tumefaciens TaxID=358 RepID=UPI002FDBE4F1